MPGFAVDSHPQKDKIIEGILAGRTVREIARSVVPQIAYCAVQRYKANVVKPVLARAEETDRILITKNPPKPLTVSPQVQQKVIQAIQDAPALSIFRQRLEKLHGRIDKTLDRAESAVRVTQDKEGNEVVIGQDISPMAPLFNAASKNLEMLGRATGELEPAGGSQVSIQILVPAAGSGEMPRVTFASPDALELAAPEDEDDGMADIGVLQRSE